MKIYEVNNRFYSDRNQAVLEALNTLYMVKTHELNDSVHMESWREGEDVCVESENEDKIDVDYDLEVADTSGYFEESKEWQIDNIKIKGKLLELIDIDQELKDAILYNVEMVAEKRNNEN